MYLSTDLYNLIHPSTLNILFWAHPHFLFKQAREILRIFKAMLIRVFSFLVQESLMCENTYFGAMRIIKMESTPKIMLGIQTASSGDKSP